MSKPLSLVPEPTVLLQLVWGGSGESPPAKTSLMIHRHMELRVQEVDAILLPTSSHSRKILRYPLLKHFSPILPVFDGAA